MANADALVNHPADPKERVQRAQLYVADATILLAAWPILPFHAPTTSE
jgi:hypothetical protein